MGNNGANCGGSCGGLTTINQTIGSSGASNRSREVDIDRSLSASRSAELTATREVDKSYKTEHNGESGFFIWGGNSFNSTSETDYNSKRDAAYKASYDTSYSSSYSALNEASSQDGTISGVFIKDAGQTTSTISDSYSYKDASGDAVAGSVNREADGGTLFVASGSGAIVSSDLTRTTSFVQDKASSNDVTVKGIGANNNVVAADTANFTTEINKPTATTDANASGTASGSAAGGVNTTASASASSSTFVNSFVQAY